MVAKCTKAELKITFGLKFKSPKEKEKTGAKREKRAKMCDFAWEASPKDGTVEEGSDIIVEHEFHARNAESAGNHITDAFSRENLCFGNIGGGNETRTQVRRTIRKSQYYAFPLTG